MKLIVGLGNPGEKYAKTRHNAGFMAIDFIIAKLGFKPTNFQKKFQSEILEIQIGDKKTIFAKPQTFMNDSGRAVKEICNFYKLDVAKDLLVIHDDSDLPFGTIRSTNSSSSAGHNGVKDVIEKLGTQDFQRIRIGVESRTSRDELPTEVFVLQSFSQEEIEKLEKEILPNVYLEIQKYLKIEN